MSTVIDATFGSVAVRRSGGSVIVAISDGMGDVAAVHLTRAATALLIGALQDAGREAWPWVEAS